MLRSPLRKATPILVIASLALASTARPAPTLFAGNLELVSSYAPDLICGNRSAHGPAGAACLTPLFGNVSSPIQTASVTAGRGFTVPTRAFSTYLKIGPTSYSGYPTYTGYRSRTQTGKGVFQSGYAPSGLIVFPAATTAPPQDPMAPRVGLMRILPGPNGFGGQMRFRDYLYASSTIAAITDGFYYTNVMRIVDLQRGSGPVGAMGSRISGNGSHSTFATTGGSPLMVSILGATTRPGWFTGTASVTDMIGDEHTAFFTVTAMDNRNTAGTTGTISLVSPLLLWTYWGRDGSVLELRDGHASYATLNLRLLPEPMCPLLVASGMIGLLTLYRSRRRRGPSP